MPIAAIFILVPVFAGCATSGSVRQTQPGDIAGIHFQCLLRSGEIAAATDDRTVGKDLPRSNIYVVRSKTEPVPVAVKSPDEKLTEEIEKPFEEEIVARLAGYLTGQKEGETRHVELTAQDISLRKKADYVINLSRFRKEPKEIKMTIDRFKSLTGMSPETGKVFSYDSAFDGRVEDVAEKEVDVRLLPKEGAVVKTPFGDEHVTMEEDNFYMISIDARVESLVRSAHLIGRITDVDDKTMTIDYRNPFGRETLSCDVTVQSITEAESNKDKTSEK
jgi:FKBP-type peptidyl-prolyl cis-trans isomerase 2